MSTLLRFDPFGDLDRMFEQAMNQRRRPSFPMDAYRHGDTVVVHFDLPGVDPASITRRVRTPDPLRLRRAHVEPRRR